jgi:hypothetical protein
MDSLAANGIAVLIAPDAKKRKGARPGGQGRRYEWMRRVLLTELDQRLYRTRSQTIEPMFAHTKHNRKMNRFHRRGTSAARTAWRLITAHPQPHQAPQPHPGGRHGMNPWAHRRRRHRTRPVDPPADGFPRQPPSLSGVADTFAGRLGSTARRVRPDILDRLCMAFGPGDTVAFHAGRGVLADDGAGAACCVVW